MLMDIHIYGSIVGTLSPRWDLLTSKGFKTPYELALKLGMFFPKLYFLKVWVILEAFHLEYPKV